MNLNTCVTHDHQKKVKKKSYGQKQRILRSSARFQDSYRWGRRERWWSRRRRWPGWDPPTGYCQGFHHLCNGNMRSHTEKPCTIVSQFTTYTLRPEDVVRRWMHSTKIGSWHFQNINNLFPIDDDAVRVWKWQHGNYYFCFHPSKHIIGWWR